MFLEEELVEGLENSRTRLKNLYLENLTQHLGKLIGIDLEPICGIAVNVPTKEKSDDLMKIYEMGGWVDYNGELPTKYNPWNRYKKNSCVEIKDEFRVYSKKHFLDLNKDYCVITLDEFYKHEKISSRQIKQIISIHNGIKNLLSERDNVSFFRR